MGNVPGVSRVGPPRDQGVSVQVHATWPCSAPVRPFLANAEYPRGLEAFVAPAEWSAVVGVVDRSIAAGRPGARVTVSNFTIFFSLLFILAGVLVGIPKYLISCVELADSMQIGNSDCATSKTIGYWTAALMLLAIWLASVQMPRLSKQWCARAAEELLAGLAEMHSVAPKLDFVLQNASELNISLHISPSATALRQKALDDKLVRLTSDFYTVPHAHPWYQSSTVVYGATLQPSAQP